MTPFVEKIQSGCNVCHVDKFVIFLKHVFAPIFKIEIKEKTQDNLYKYCIHCSVIIS